MTLPEDKKPFVFPEGLTPEEEKEFIHQAFVLALAVAHGAGGLIKLGLSFLDEDSRPTSSSGDTLPKKPNS